jgi:F0F1-type ATP synthase assembly protein I
VAGEDPEKPPEYVRPTMPFEREAQRSSVGRWSAAGFEFAAAVVLFFLGGRALDGKLGTAPWLTVSGSLIGVAAGIWLLVRTALSAERRSKDTGADGRGSEASAEGRGRESAAEKREQ